ncbi:BTB/POZ and MATH domain-containing protein 1 [Setaria viridis]|uniref:BTB/POZ and MATH domain-containing protein 1 n=1 Tax=Setaria viridis TaxID=4556 RepID=UPI0014932C6F|nr:BTB/POZ and MATH domain-containing protein 1-like [Setaria viridis]
MLDSRFVEFKLDYTKAKDVAIGAVVSSEDISAGGHLWRVNCYPRGSKKEDAGEHLSLYLELVSNDSKNVRAIFDAFAIIRDGTPSWSDARRRADVYTERGATKGWHRFVTRRYLDSLYVTAGGWVTVMCGVIVVLDDDALPPPPDVGAHLGRLLDRADGSDVSFIVGGEAFPAHRAVLAARSPVFRAQLLGSMADATMPSIALHDIAPETFRAMLRFIYTDALPAADEEMMRHLLAAADRYALDRLKIVCARISWDNVSVDTVATTLDCAEMYSCPELKRKCIKFFAAKKNFKKAVLTKGFVQLGQRFPSVIDELRERVVGLRL